MRCDEQVGESSEARKIRTYTLSVRPKSNFGRFDRILYGENGYSKYRSSEGGVYQSEKAFIITLLTATYTIERPCYYGGITEQPFHGGVKFLILDTDPSAVYEATADIMCRIQALRQQKGKSMKIETRSGMELLNLVGRRVLLKNTSVGIGDQVFEARVLEASPRGLIKLDMGIVQQWRDPEDFWLVEVLLLNFGDARDKKRILTDMLDQEIDARIRELAPHGCEKGHID